MDVWNKRNVVAALLLLLVAAEKFCQGENTGEMNERNFHFCCFDFSKSLSQPIELV